MSFSLKQLADYLAAEFKGDANHLVDSVAALNKAKSNNLSFLHKKKYADYLASCQAGIVLLTKSDAAAYMGNCIIVDDTYVAYAKLSHLFVPKTPKPQIAASAVVADSAQIGINVSIGHNAVIGANCQMGDNCQIGAGVVIENDCQIGANCVIYPNVTLYYGVLVGDNVIIHSGAVIGADGFGFAKEQNTWHKIAQLGTVEIGDNVEIGANTTIDRGALDNTKIGSGVKLDNQIMIAHNVEIGDNTALAACCGISGSSKIGKNCMLAGGVGLVGHIEICDDVFISGMTMVTHSITKAGSYSSGTAMQTLGEWKKSAVHFRRLDVMARKIAAISKKLQSFNLKTE